MRLRPAGEEVQRLGQAVAVAVAAELGVVGAHAQDAGARQPAVHDADAHAGLLEHVAVLEHARDAAAALLAVPLVDAERRAVYLGEPGHDLLLLLLDELLHAQPHRRLVAHARLPAARGRPARRAWASRSGGAAARSSGGHTERGVSKAGGGEGGEGGWRVCGLLTILYSSRHEATARPPATTRPVSPALCWGGQWVAAAAAAAGEARRGPATARREERRAGGRRATRSSRRCQREEGPPAGSHCSAESRRAAVHGGWHHLRQTGQRKTFDRGHRPSQTSLSSPLSD